MNFNIFILSSTEVGPEVSAVRPEVFARRGLKAKLVCSIDAYPSPHIWWFKDGKGNQEGAAPFLLQILFKSFFSSFDRR